jgi:hypothetical protein
MSRKTRNKHAAQRLRDRKRIIDKYTNHLASLALKLYSGSITREKFENEVKCHIDKQQFAQIDKYLTPSQSNISAAVKNVKDIDHLPDIDIDPSSRLPPLPSSPQNNFPLTNPDLHRHQHSQFNSLPSINDIVQQQRQQQQQQHNTDQNDLQDFLDMLNPSKNLNNNNILLPPNELQEQ